MQNARWLLAAIVALGTTGCATYNTSILVWPRLDRIDEGVHTDHIYEVSTAYRDPGGNLLVCVRGAPAGRAWWLGDTEFALVVPHGVLSGQPAAGQVGRGVWAPSKYVLSAKDIEDHCPPRVAGADDYSALPIRRLTPGDFGSRAVDDVPKDRVRAVFGSEASRPALYVISGQWIEGSTVQTTVIVYVHDSVVARESPALEIGTAPRQVGSQYAWALALPFAVAVDLVTLPLELLVLLVGH